MKTTNFKGTLVLCVVLALGAPNAIFAATPGHDSRSSPSDDTVITRVARAIKRVVRTILEQPGVPIPVPPTQ